MEDSVEVHSEENRVSADKNVKRKLKTPGQVIALENFYNEHKYPSEEMKTVLAEQIGLTEKQISSWFCHRRLKDKRVRHEVHTNGRQDRSSGINQDRGSGLFQDSCGSTKQGDYKNTDGREVESERLYSQDFPTADRTSRYTGNLGGVDNTSSESGSSLEDKFISHEDPYNEETSKHPSDIYKGINNMEYKPSGYLKVKGEIENAAITAVKWQLGRHYRMDGPLLGVEFDELPLGAFASPNGDPVNGPIYVGDISRIRDPDVSGSQKYCSLSSDFYMEEANNSPEYGFDSHDRNFCLNLKRKPINDYANLNAGENTAMDGYEDLYGETSIYSQRRPYVKNSKHQVDMIRSDSVSNQHSSSGRRAWASGDHKEALLHDYDNGSTKVVQGNDYISRPSHPKLGSSIPLEEAPGLRMKKCGEKKGVKRCHDPIRTKKHSTNEITVAAPVRAQLPQQEFVTKESFGKLPRKTKLVRRTAKERPSSFSEDETAETSLSAD